TVDARTDVWSLGLCFYEGLTGRLPWGDYESVYQTIIAVCEQPVTWIQDVAPWVGSELADVVHRMLAREPSERYQTMFDVVQALCPFTNGDDGFEREELRGVDAETRLLVARRPSVRLRLSSAQGAKPNSSARLRAFAGQRSRWLSLGGGLIATAIVAMSSWLLLRPSEPDPASRIPSRSEASGSVLAGVNPKKPPTVASTPVSTLPGPTISAAGAAVAFSGRSRDLARGHSAKAPGLRVQQQPQPLPSSNGTGAQTGQELAEQPSTKKPSYIEQLPLE
ncbi:MAG TPA: hypothetical protein VKP30_24975, partial [Polyangiaceae bacterium]|nr:hypothetical protein [Polyangiaceae bacterium]